MDMPQDPNKMLEGLPKEGAESRTEVTVCLYADGKVALKLDGGEEVPVESLDKALAGIKAIAMEERGEAAEGPEMSEDPAAEGGEAQAFASGFQGVRGAA